MTHAELDYEIPFRPLTVVWLAMSVVLVAFAVSTTRPLITLAFLAIVLVWINFCSTLVHYVVDVEAFTTWPWVGRGFARIQEHHLPQWMNVVHKKSVLDLMGELNLVAVVNLVSPLLLFGMRSSEAYVAFAFANLAAGYGLLCHRWSHQSRRARPVVATWLQRAHLALRPEVHGAHHAMALQPDVEFVPNYDISFGWSNGAFNWALQRFPYPRAWLVLMVVSVIGQVPLLAVILRLLKG